MAVIHYTRNDISMLADRLAQRSRSILLSDQPNLCWDMRAAAKLLMWMIETGAPITTVEIENGLG